MIRENRPGKSKAYTVHAISPPSVRPVRSLGGPGNGSSERDCVVEGCLIILFRKVGISEAAEKLRRETWVDHRFETSQQRLAINHD